MVIDLVGFGIVLPILPLWAKLRRLAHEIGLLTASYAVAQLLFAPLWGRLSDRYGRRPVILASLAGSAVAALLIGLAQTLLLLWVARVLQGVAGASYAAGQAYVADVTTARDRARGMGLIGAAFGLGFIPRAAFGAVFSAVDARLPFFVAAGLAALNLVIAHRRLPESLRPGAPRAPAPGSRSCAGRSPAASSARWSGSRSSRPSRSWPWRPPSPSSASVASTTGRWRSRRSSPSSG